MKNRKITRGVKSYKKSFKRDNEKAVSPVIATILLIMIVIIIAIIIILWFRVFLKESLTKDINGNIKKVEDYCREVSLKQILNEDSTFGVTNEGNVPISEFKLKVSKTDGTSEIIEALGRLNPGFTTMFEVDNSAGGIYKRSDFESVKIIPVLLGKRKSGAVEAVTCPEKDGIDI